MENKERREKGVSSREKKWNRKEEINKWREKRESMKKENLIKSIRRETEKLTRKTYFE